MLWFGVGLWAVSKTHFDEGFVLLASQGAGTQDLGRRGKKQRTPPADSCMIEYEVIASDRSIMTIIAWSLLVCERPPNMSGFRFRRACPEAQKFLYVQCICK